MEFQVISSHSPWFEQGEESRQPLERFTQLMHRHILPLTTMRDVLYDASTPFQKKDVMPFHCRKAITSLTIFGERIDKLCALFSDASVLPLTMIALRYRFLDELYYVGEQTDNLASLIDSYYESCLTSSPQSRRQEKAINELFSTLLQCIANIPQQANYLLSEARFEEKRLHLA